MSGMTFGVRYNNQVYRNGDTINAKVGDTAEIVYYNDENDKEFQGTVVVGGTAIENGFTYTEPISTVASNSWSSIGSVILSDSGNITVEWNGELFHHNPNFPMGSESGSISVNVNPVGPIHTTVLIKQGEADLIGNTFEGILEPDTTYTIGELQGKYDLPDILYCSINGGTDKTLNLTFDDIDEGTGVLCREWTGAGIILRFLTQIVSDKTTVEIKFNSQYYPYGVKGNVLINTVEINPMVETNSILRFNDTEIASHSQDNPLKKGDVINLGEIQGNPFEDLDTLYLSVNGASPVPMSRKKTDIPGGALYEYKCSKGVLTAVYSSLTNSCGVAFRADTDLNGNIVVSDINTVNPNECIVQINFKDYNKAVKLADGLSKGISVPVANIPIEYIPDDSNIIYININGSVKRLNHKPIVTPADEFGFAWASDDEAYVVMITGKKNSSEGTVYVYIKGSGIVSGTVKLTEDPVKAEGIPDINGQTEGITVKYDLVYEDINGTNQHITGSSFFDSYKLSGSAGYYSGVVVVSNLPPVNVSQLLDNNITVQVAGYYLRNGEWKPVVGTVKLPMVYTTLDSDGQYALWYLNDLSGTLTDDEGNSLEGFTHIQVGIKTYTNLLTGNYTEVKIMLIPIGTGNYQKFKGKVSISLSDFQPPQSSEIQIQPDLKYDLPLHYKDNKPIRLDNRLHSRNIPLPTDSTTITYPLYIKTDVEYRISASAYRSDTSQELPVNVDLVGNKIDIDIQDNTTGGYTVILQINVQPDW